MRRLEREHATTLVTLANEQLDALARGGSELFEERPDRCGERKPLRCQTSERYEAVAEFEAAGVVTPEDAVRLEGGGQTVRGGARQLGLGLQLTERARFVDDGSEDVHGFVEHADPGYDFHIRGH